ncbi:hypothetical protein [Gracilimonas sediminicola]|uniref:Uncharacterized protein n=1 Tax=Gracilimonas sediminicola TaxID=2952158 RepID=A0A9X2L557_9BACT|nr:hypothetical protein [Gracilimonas sediminicola]MCP9292517.1 hypothetical protein [Gracilimonas sediminicola]
MKRKNEIEQELDQKEFENDIGKDLAQQYRKLNIEEKLREDANKYVVGVLYFTSTLVFFEVLWWLLSSILGPITLGILEAFFETMTPFMHVVFLIMAISSAITWKSPITYILKLTPNGWYD